MIGTHSSIVGKRELKRRERGLHAARKRLQELEYATVRDLDHLDRGGVLTEDEYVTVRSVRGDEKAKLEKWEAQLTTQFQDERVRTELAERLPVEIRSFVEDIENLDVTRQEAWLQTILKAAHIWNDGRAGLEFRD